MKILVTGVAGFIGFHVAKQLIAEKHEVVGVDTVSNSDNYYDVELKYARLRELGVDYIPYTKVLEVSDYFTFFNVDMNSISDVSFDFDVVIHMAGNSGIRGDNSISFSYLSDNIIGFNELLQRCSVNSVKHFIFPSTSWTKERTQIDTSSNIGKYILTKMVNECCAETFAYQNQMNITCLRLYTVYGEWGRPDMVFYKYVDAIYNNKPIKAYKHAVRDFTYVGDVARCISNVLKVQEKQRFYQSYNLGSGKLSTLHELIEQIEDTSAERFVSCDFIDSPKGECEKPMLNGRELFLNNYGNFTFTSLEEGVEKFITWYKNYNKIWKD